LLINPLPHIKTFITLKGKEMRHLLVVLTLTALASCAPKSSSDSVRVIDTSIMNGSVVKEGDVLASSIVGIFNSKLNAVCTGSLIAPNVVLTAAHCAPDKASDIKIVFSNDLDYVLNSREPDIQAEFVLQATDFKVSKSWDPNNETIEIDTGDIALIKFKGTIPAGYKPATILADDSKLKRGDMITVAGFGVDTVTTTPIDPKSVKDIDEAIAYGEITCDENQQGKKFNCLKIESSGDGILRVTEAPIASIQETEFRLNEKKAGTCNGDSGGPAYLKVNGQLFLLGVTSRGSELCNDTGVYTNAVYYKTWINDTMKILK
jgi:secreted trypsin-like serine protease